MLLNFGDQALSFLVVFLHPFVEGLNAFIIAAGFELFLGLYIPGDFVQAFFFLHQLLVFLFYLRLAFFNFTGPGFKVVCLRVGSFTALVIGFFALLGFRRVCFL